VYSKNKKEVFMSSRVGNFFTAFFHNMQADPVSTYKGLVQLASASAACYGMATGTVPVNQLSIGTTTALLASGLHAIGTDSTTGKTDESVTDVVELIARMKEDAAKGQSAVAQFESITKAVSEVITPEKKD
jgi:ABC-type uncharacterized transport system permease subunit